MIYKKLARGDGKANKNMMRLSIGGSGKRKRSPNGRGRNMDPHLEEAQAVLIPVIVGGLAKIGEAWNWNLMARQHSAYMFGCIW